MKKDNKTRKSFKHLNELEREIISILWNQGQSKSYIAKTLGRHRSTICREIRRHTILRRNFIYIGTIAHKRYRSVKKVSASKRRLKNDYIRNFVEENLRKGESPELISGKLKAKQGIKISHEAIYQYIYSEPGNLIKYLVRGHKKRKKRSLKRSKRSVIKNRVNISERSFKADSRREVVEAIPRIRDCEFLTLSCLSIH